jgi:hypothetical protein
MMPTEKIVTSRSAKSGGNVASRLHKQKADGVGVSTILSPVDAIYHEFVKIFGNSNQSQVFSLIWPGTILDPASYDGVGDNGVDGILASIAQSLLFDQHYPVGTITQTDGTRVSDRYGQAIQRYGVVPNASLLSLQSILRDRLSQVTQTSINGQLVSMTLLDQFNYLNGIWTDRRQQWDDKQTATIQQFKAGGDANWFADYVEWYGINAQPYLDSINAAYDRLIAEFPLNAFQDALSILGTQEAAALLRARNDLANATIPVPASIGNDYVVTQAIPEDWGSVLTSSMTFVDLLASPQAQQAALDTAITVLQQQIYAWQAILAQIPAGSAADIAAALAAFEDAGNTYSAAVDSTLNTYTNNAVTAVQIFMNNQQDETTLGQINQAKQDMDIAAGDQPADLNQEQVDAIIKDIGQGQSDLITSNSSMVSAGYNLASKATAYLNSKNGAGLKSMIQPVVDQLTSQLALVTQKAADFTSSAARAQQLAAGASPAFKDGPVLDPVMPSNASSTINQRWSEITLSVNTSAMDTSSTASTSYEQMNWSVDLFFGSAGGESSEASSSFASDYMKQDSAIEIGMLATKVVIQRPWMHPELFNMSSNYFRVSQYPVTTPTPPDGGWTRDLIVPQELGGGAPGTSGGMAARALNQGPFPAYPVALLLVKDVTIKFSYDSAKTSAFEQQSSSNSTQGGGFFCFSVSEQQSSSSDVKGSSSYSQAGTYAFKIAAPQVIGTWLQITPQDNSVPLDETLASEIADSLGFVTKLQVVAKAGRAVFNPPSQPRAS